MGFIVSASNLRAQMYGIKGRVDQFTCPSILAACIVLPFEHVPCKGNFGHLYQWDTKIPTEEFADINQLRDYLVSTLPSESSFEGMRLNGIISMAAPAQRSIWHLHLFVYFRAVIEYEKDDNLHVDFVSTTSTLYARCYHIKV
jgi:hypothetical protein